MKWTGTRSQVVSNSIRRRNAFFHRSSNYHLSNIMIATLFRFWLIWKTIIQLRSIIITVPMKSSILLITLNKPTPGWPMLSKAIWSNSRILNLWHNPRIWRRPTSTDKWTSTIWETGAAHYKTCLRWKWSVCQILNLKVQIIFIHSRSIHSRCIYKTKGNSSNPNSITECQIQTTLEKSWIISQSRCRIWVVASTTIWAPITII